MKGIVLAIAVAAPLGLSLASPAARADTEWVSDSISANPTTIIVWPRLYVSKRIWLVSAAPRDASWADLRRSTFHRAQARVPQHSGERLSRRDLFFRTWKNGRPHIVYVNSRTGGFVAGLAIEAKPTTTASGRRNLQPRSQGETYAWCIAVARRTADSDHHPSLSFSCDLSGSSPRTLPRIACQSDATA